jgi:hypothetical protein
MKTVLTRMFYELQSRVGELVVDIGKRVYLVVKDLIRIQSYPTFDEKAS